MAEEQVEHEIKQEKIRCPSCQKSILVPTVIQPDDPVKCSHCKEQWPKRKWINDDKGPDTVYYIIPPSFVRFLVSAILVLIGLAVVGLVFESPRPYMVFAVAAALYIWKNIIAALIYLSENRVGR